MNCLKPASTVLLLALSLAVAGVCAQHQQLPESHAEKATTAQAPAARRKPVKRRAVQQVIEPTPRIVTDGYRPTLTVRPPAASLPEPLPAPVRLNGCDAGGCNDTNGQRYNSGVGNTLLGPQGQLCTRGVVGAQCF